MAKRDITGWLPNLIGPISVEINGAPVSAPKRSTWNIKGSTVSIADNPDNDSTDFTFSPELIDGFYSVALPTYADGASAPVSLDVNGRVLVNASPPLTTWIHAGAAVAEKQLVTGAGSVWQIYVTNAGASTEYIFIFDAAARPGNGVTTELWIPIPISAGGAVSIDLPKDLAFASGLYVGASSTAGTFTYDSAATLLISCERQ